MTTIVTAGSVPIASEIDSTDHVLMEVDGATRRVALSTFTPGAAVGNYTSRAGFVAAVAAGLSVSSGAVIVAAGLSYVYDGTNNIADLPGWAPNGDYEAGHFGDNSVPGTTDMTVALQAGVDALAAAGGGDFIIREDCLLSASSEADTMLYIVSGPAYDTKAAADVTCLILRDGVTLILENGAALISSNTNRDVVTCLDMNKGGIIGRGGKKGRITANWSGSGSGHGIHMASSVVGKTTSDLTFSDLEIHNVGSYGIGVQYGDQFRNTYRNLYIHDVGADGIDHKVRMGPLTQSHGVLIDNVVIERHGQRAGITESAGIDIRGPVVASNIWVRDFAVAGADNLGLVFSSALAGTIDERQTSSYSSITNFHIDAGDPTIQSRGARFLSSRGSRLSNGVIRNCQDGFVFEEASSGVGDKSEHSSITDVLIEAAWDRAVDIKSKGARCVNVSVESQIDRFSDDRDNMPAGTTVLTTPRDFNAGAVEVWKNGVQLATPADYTTTGTDTVTLVVPTIITDVVEVITPTARGFYVSSNNATLIGCRTDEYVTTPKTIGTTNQDTYIEVGCEFGENLPLVNDLFPNSRSSFVTWAANNTVRDGTVFQVDGLDYVASSGATAIGDLAGWLPHGVPYFEHFGADPSGVSDSADQIQECLAWAEGNRPVVTCFGGTYLLTATRSADPAGRLANLQFKDGVHVYGNGGKLKRSATPAGSRGVIFLEHDITSGGIYDLEVDANDAAISSPTVHGIYKNGNLENYAINNVIIRNTSAYGLGLQDQDGVSGTKYTKNCRFTNLWIYNSGNDGIDVKDNSASTGFNVFQNILVDGFGLDSSDTTCIGLHLRGSQTMASHLHVINPAATNTGGTGIKVDTIATSPVTAEGGTVSNFFVDMGTVATPCIQSRRDYVTWSNGVCKSNAATSIFTVEGGSTNVTITGVQLFGNSVATTGFISGDATDTDITYNGCIVLNCATGMSLRGTRETVTGCVIRNTTTNGISIGALATGTVVQGGRVSVSGGSKVTDSSGVAKIHNLVNFVNRAKISGSFAIDSTGVKSVTVAHGMDVTPAVGDCQISFGANTPTGADAWESAWIKVDSTDATNVYAQTRILTTSLSSGETCDFHVHVNSEKF